MFGQVVVKRDLTVYENRQVTPLRARPDTKTHYSCHPCEGRGL